MIVDDDLDILEGLALFLTGEGYETTCVKDGGEALRAVRGTTPNLIILDVMLPDIDGFKVCERLKQDPDTRGIPIIFLTVKDQLKHKIQGYSSGASRYMVKPFEEDELLRTIQIVLRQREITEKAYGRDVMDPRD
jgi:DNA-binding response OmpR family regulator